MLFGLLFAWPLVRRWLPAGGRLTAAVTAFGFSAGALSLWLFALALVPGALSLWTGLALPGAVCVVGLWAGRKEQEVRGRGQGARSKEQG